MLLETEVTFLELIEGLLAEEEAVDGLLETIEEAAGGGGDADDGGRLPDQRAAKRQESARPQTAVKLDAMMGRLFETLDRTKVCMHRVHGPCALCTSMHPAHL